ncbi:MAG: hypothetical protein ACJAXE_002812, partial [Neolewinella sp.]
MEEIGFSHLWEHRLSAKFILQGGPLDWRKLSNHKLNLALPIIAGIN